MDWVALPCGVPLKKYWLIVSWEEGAVLVGVRYSGWSMTSKFKVSHLSACEAP